ncbi:MAG: multiheme c-type cytochrome, partial [bacterium]
KKIQQYLNTDSTRVILIDPKDILAQYLSELRNQSDQIIVLAHMPALEAESIAHQFPEIDILISGHDPQEQVINLKRVGQTIIVHGRDRSRYGESLLLYLDQQKRIIYYRQQETLLSALIANDPEVEALVKQYRTKLATISPLPVLVSPGEQEPKFVGASACQSCHQEAYQVWEKSPHANAYTSLKKNMNGNQRECLRCHTLGVGRTDGFIAEDKTPNLAGVQCETCHQPGSFHIQSPIDKKKETIAFPPDAKLCWQCHTQDTSPDFRYFQALKYISHKK